MIILSPDDLIQKCGIIKNKKGIWEWKYRGPLRAVFISYDKDVVSYKGYWKSIYSISNYSEGVIDILFNDNSHIDLAHWENNLEDSSLVYITEESDILLCQTMSKFW